MEIPILINSSSRINGEMILSTDVRIEGEVFGKVESDKTVIIGSKGFFKGFLRAKDLVVFGRIEGTLVVSGITILHESASILGNLYTHIFEVKDGAIVTAKVVTYEKLKAIDETQICMAEELIKVEPGHRLIQNDAPIDISFEESIVFKTEDHIDSNLTKNKILIDRTLAPIQQDKPVELAQEIRPATDTKRNNFIKLDFDDSLRKNEELVHVAFSGPVSTASYLGEPINEDSQRIRKVKINAESSDPALTPPTAQKSKGFNLSGFDELKNRLIPARFHDKISNGKKNV